ncbi:MAG TPA: AmmeMemoRadiSam system radical SAM enzyme [Elusimicrobiales bacterium]|nr:AmmeMemoRadiSam system radical SAM enzyme [Elusimicrobiales bacterium]
MNSLRKLSKEAVLYEKLPGGKTACRACAHRCVTGPGGTGRCGVRYNDHGILMAPWGYVSGAAADPVEKKPFFHALPGSVALSFGMFGCNFKCDFCQNWNISDARAGGLQPLETSPGVLLREAGAAGARSVISTYNEPLITAEWSREIFAAAKAAGLRTGFVSNGYATPETAAFLRPVMDFWKVDLKTFNDERYRAVCGGELEKVKTGLETILKAGFWVEIVTLLIPGFNDSGPEISAMAAYLAGLSRDIPWHLTAFHPDHRMTAAPPTPPETLLRARETALRKGMRYVYCGNIRSRGSGLEDTACPACGRKVVERDGFTVKKNILDAGGGCPCGEKIPGIWS